MKPSVPTSTAGSSTATTTEMPKNLTMNKKNILRLKRHLDLERELSSAASEDENLAIEQVRTLKLAESIHYTEKKEKTIYFYRVMFQMV